MKLFLPNFYIDMRTIINQPYPFILILGGRATGKTYGALKMMVEDNYKFMLIRRTQAQADIINIPELSPFKPICRDMHIDITTSKMSKYNAKFEKDGEIIGYSGALSTFSNIRGFDGSDLDILLYDEFVSERHERPLKAEGEAFKNAYETINRNRELEGRPPLKAICMGNTNNVANPLFLEFGLVDRAMTMQAKGEWVWKDNNRGIMMILIEDSIISKLKRNTALYIADADSAYSKMALENSFVYNEFGMIRSKPLIEYRPVVGIGEIHIYEHKSNKRFYVSTHKTGSAPYFPFGDASLKRFRNHYLWLWDEYLDEMIDFEKYSCEVLLTKYLLRV